MYYGTNKGSEQQAAAIRAGYGSGIGDHAAGPHDLGQISSWHHSGWLLVDSALEAGWAPIHELDGPLGGYGCVHILGDQFSSLHDAGSHVLSVSRITLGLQRCVLERVVGALYHRQYINTK